MAKKIDLSLVQKLRQRTGMGMLDCRKSLEEAGGDLDAAIQLLRKKGASIAAARSDKETAQGIIESYIHPGGSVGVLVEVNCETDFVARTDDFKQFARDIAMHIAATNPLVVDKDNVPEDLLSKERDIYSAQAEESGKPAEIIEKMVEGRIKKYLDEICLVGQPFVKDPDKTVDTLLKAENAAVVNFVRFEVGEGIEKKEENFAEEVMAQVRES